MKRVGRQIFSSTISLKFPYKWLSLIIKYTDNPDDCKDIVSNYSLPEEPKNLLNLVFFCIVNFDIPDF